MARAGGKEECAHEKNNRSFQGQQIWEIHETLVYL